MCTPSYLKILKIFEIPWDHHMYPYLSYNFHYAYLSPFLTVFKKNKLFIRLAYVLSILFFFLITYDTVNFSDVASLYFWCSRSPHFGPDRIIPSISTDPITLIFVAFASSSPPPVSVHITCVFLRFSVVGKSNNLVIVAIIFWAEKSRITPKMYRVSAIRLKKIHNHNMCYRICYWI